MNPQIDKGVQHLDAKHPDWLDRVDPKKLDMTSPKLCMLGQLGGFYENLRKHPDYAKKPYHLLLEWAGEHGFMLTGIDRRDDYVVLTAQWVATINRLKAERSQP